MNPGANHDGVLNARIDGLFDPIGVLEISQREDARQVDPFGGWFEWRGTRGCWEFVVRELRFFTGVEIPDGDGFRGTVDVRHIAVRVRTSRFIR